MRLRLPSSTIVHGGMQSMPLTYDNTAKFSFSEATRTFATAQNWTTSGIKSLSLWFQGAATNTGGQLYVKINGTKVSYNGNAGDLAKAAWIPWNIDLSTVDRPEQGDFADDRHRGLRQQGHPVRR